MYVVISWCISEQITGSIRRRCGHGWIDASCFLWYVGSFFWNQMTSVVNLDAPSSRCKTLEILCCRIIFSSVCLSVLSPNAGVLFL